VFEDGWKRASKGSVVEGGKCLGFLSRIKVKGGVVKQHFSNPSSHLSGYAGAFISMAARFFEFPVVFFIP
jgi:hypothetical protein